MAKTTASRKSGKQLPAGVVIELALSQLREDEHNVRKTFDAGKLKELATDLARRGMESPIVVTTNGKGAIIKHGARRFRAAKLAKLKKVPCIVVAAPKPAKGETDALRRLFDQVADNFQREDLNPIDFAHFLKTLRDVHKIPVAKMPDLLKKNGLAELSRSHLQNMIGLLDLPKWAIELIHAGIFTPKHATAIRAAMQSKKVLAELEKNAAKKDAFIEIDEDDVRHTTSSTELLRYVEDLFEKHHVDLSKTAEYHSEDRVYYDPKKLKPAEQQELKIVELPSTWRGGQPHQFALNDMGHQRINKAARESFELRQKQQTARASSGGGRKKAKGNDAGSTEANPQRVEQHLWRFLNQWVFTCLFVHIDPAKHDKREFTISRIFDWLACGAFRAYCDTTPRRKGDPAIHPDDYNFLTGFDDRPHADVARQLTAFELGLLGISDFLEAADTDATTPSVVRRLLMTNQANPPMPILSIDTLARIAKFLDFDLDKDFRVDADYCKLHTKAGLDALVKSFATRAGGDTREAWRKCAKTKQMHEFCVQHADGIGVPADIRAAWDEAISDEDVARGHGKPIKFETDDEEREAE